MGRSIYSSDHHTDALSLHSPSRADRYHHVIAERIVPGYLCLEIAFFSAIITSQCDGSYCSDLGGDPEVSSVMGPTVVTWVGTLRCPVSPV